MVLNHLNRQTGGRTWCSARKDDTKDDKALLDILPPSGQHGMSSVMSNKRLPKKAGMLILPIYSFILKKLLFDCLTGSSCQVLDYSRLFILRFRAIAVRCVGVADKGGKLTETNFVFLTPQIQTPNWSKEPFEQWERRQMMSPRSSSQIAHIRIITGWKRAPLVRTILVNLCSAASIGCTAYFDRIFVSNVSIPLNFHSRTTVMVSWRNINFRGER